MDLRAYSDKHLLPQIFCGSDIWEIHSWVIMSRVFHETAVKMLVKDAAFWKFAWSWRIHFPFSRWSPAMAAGWGAQFLTMWASPKCCSQQSGFPLRERKRVRQEPQSFLWPSLRSCTLLLHSAHWQQATKFGHTQEERNLTPTLQFQRICGYFRATPPRVSVGLPRLLAPWAWGPEN